MATAIEQFLKKQGEKLVLALDRALPREKDATGSLRESIRFTVKRFGIEYKFELHLNDYYLDVDRGRRPGERPPQGVIEQWIKDKRLVIHPKYGLQVKRPKSKLKQISDDAATLKSVAFAIREKIYRRGITPTPFYSRAVPPWLETFKIELAKEFGQDILVDIKKDFLL